MKTNTATALAVERTHEGARSASLKPLQELRRTVLACLLFENAFYESGVAIEQRIADLCAKVDPLAVAALAIEARVTMNLRHVPLRLALAVMGRLPRKAFTALVDAVTKRADDVTELLALYWKDGKKPLPNAFRYAALPEALRKFDRYQLSKYAARGPIRLRDILFLTHAKPRDAEQEALWKELADDTLPTADTWEARLSAGADKRQTFESLLAERRMGGLAILRNLRNMAESGVERETVERELMRLAPKSGILPFQFVAAARAVPQWEAMIEAAMFVALDALPKLPGRTILLVDASGSMADKLSAKSTLSRLDAAKALAMLAREVCEDVCVFSFSDDLVLHPPRRGFALGDAIGGPRGATFTGQAVGTINQRYSYDRILIFTDEQSHDVLPPPKGRGYVMNVAAYRPSVGYGPWVSVTGFSENVLRYVQAIESDNA